MEEISIGFSVVSVEFLYLGVACVFFSWLFDDGSSGIVVWLCVFFSWLFDDSSSGFRCCVCGSVVALLMVFF